MIPTLGSIKLERQGRLTVRVTGNSHCGAASAVTPNGAVDVKYIVKLEVSPNSLDNRGFIVDQEVIHAMLETAASEPLPWRSSCEMLAIVWGERLLGLLRTDNPDGTVHRLELTLSPFPHGGSLSAVFDGTPQMSARHQLRIAA